MDLAFGFLRGLILSFSFSPRANLPLFVSTEKNCQGCLENVDLTAREPCVRQQVPIFRRHRKRWQSFNLWLIFGSLVVSMLDQSNDEVWFNGADDGEHKLPVMPRLGRHQFRKVALN